jgi:hypothetical protein
MSFDTKLMNSYIWEYITAPSVRPRSRGWFRRAFARLRNMLQRRGQ